MDKKDKTVTLVVTDLDGTLLDSTKNVTPKTRKAIEKLKEHGILFGIASGRPVESGLFLCKNWGLEDSISFLIGMNGGAFYDTRRHIKENYAHLDGELIWSIIEHFRDMPNLHFEVMSGNNRYVEFSTPETLESAMIYGENEIVVDLKEYLKGRKMDKLIIRSLPEDQPKVIERSKSFHSDKVTCFPTSDVLFEYVDPNINKGYGVLEACKYYGLKPANVVAFGDESNDLEMLELAGTGVAMQNATRPVKVIADVVSDYTNDQDALAHYIEEVILPDNPDTLEIR